MTALWLRLRNGPLCTLSYWWWNHSPGHETRDRMAAAEGDILWLRSQVDGLLVMLGVCIRHMELEVPAEISGQPDPAACPPKTAPAQRDLDDAVAELVRQARQEYRRGGAR